MSEQNPYELLGVTKDASFEEIQEARNRLSQQNREDRKLVESLEAAYDAVIMDRLRMRQEGKIKVPERIRFPERITPAPPKTTSDSANKSPSWLKDTIDTPSRSDVLIPAATFVLLGLLTFLAPSPQSTIPSLTMTLGFCANIYFLNRKENRLGRAVLITLIGLVLGVGLGVLLGGSLSSPGIGKDQFATLVTFLVFWLMSSFLR
ncbi:MAG: CPP1-like family protein [Jaaginema sp. PMC 1079.18]|nr:CPP1-like family protein [Jaaginema sp. PMC 1080.18]MEC4850090.1 CPP1-like family protein [Jaaginema sp. PMC 1079.18]MEC4867571.1 CPP1-like family protein [Jaaginema sp. PMC 1078.18]